ADVRDVPHEVGARGGTVQPQPYRHRLAPEHAARRQQQRQTDAGEYENDCPRLGHRGGSLDNRFPFANGTRGDPLAITPQVQRTVLGPRERSSGPGPWALVRPGSAVLRPFLVRGPWSGAQGRRTRTRDRTRDHGLRTKNGPRPKAQGPPCQSA